MLCFLCLCLLLYLVCSWRARSVCHLQSLNKGLELKIMELQCRLIDQVRLMGIDILTFCHTHSHTHTHSLSLSLSHAHSLTLSPTHLLTLSLTHSLTHTLSLSHSLTHPLTLSPSDMGVLWVRPVTCPALKKIWVLPEWECSWSWSVVGWVSRVSISEWVREIKVTCSSNERETSC